MKAKVIINRKEFIAELYDNESARAFFSMLPLSFEMEEMNGNEKCRYLSKKLPVNSEKIEEINAGDIMLLGPSCLTVFYRSSSTGKSYTKLGRITDTEGLAEAAGKWDAEITFDAINE